MTTAREQAREAALEAWPFTKEPTFEGVEHRSQAVADAASDVWEPLLKDIVDSFWCFDGKNNTHLYEAMQRGAEALGIVLDPKRR